MRLIPIILRILANVILFCLYALIAIITINFTYGLILVNAGKVVPGSEDPIHMALAIASTGFIALITFILRKYFYISFARNEKIILKEKTVIKEVIKEVKETKQKEDIFDDEMKIYIDKEIK